MKQFHQTLPCGAKLYMLQPDPESVMVIRLTAPDGQDLKNIAQIKDNQITVVVDTVSLPEIEKLVNQFFKPKTILGRILSALKA